MPRRPGAPHRTLTAARWPLGLLVTGWTYLWRTTPMHRRELDGTWADDAPPELPGPVELAEVQRVEDGAGAFLRRRYRIAVRGADRTAHELIAEVAADPDIVAPGWLAHFSKVAGREGELRTGDEFSVRMPGPWNGPIRVVEVTPASFRFVTLAGHIEAGQIEWRARAEDGRVVFEIESWSRPGDVLSSVLHHRLGMAKEVQLHMWTSVLERVASRYGRRDGPIDIDTRRVPFDERVGPQR